MAGTSCVTLIDLLRAPDPDLNRVIPTFVSCFNASYGDPASACWDISFEDWERYEFLGDRVLNLIIAQTLFTHRHQTLTEGEMTRIMGGVVSNRALDALLKGRGTAAYTLLIPQVIGENTYGERITGGAFEAFVGALYCELGFDEVACFVTALMKGAIRDYRPDENAIGMLQEYFQKKYQTVPWYRQIHRTGPDHKPEFTYEVVFINEILGVGKGESIQQAQQAAARMALTAVMKKP